MVTHELYGPIRLLECLLECLRDQRSPGFGEDRIFAPKGRYIVGNLEQELR